jgi:acetyltransferase-like isoleucine patch superfamily enzyme
VVGLLPAGRTKNRLLGMLGRGWRVAPSARVHPSVFWRVGRLRLGERAYIGPGNIFRELARVDLADQADIGQFNWFSAQAQYIPQEEHDDTASVVLERGASITSRHYLDCAGGVRFEELSILAGVRSTVLTHYADVREWALRAEPVVVGRTSLVFSNSVITAGTTIAENVVVGAGAVVSKDLTEPGKLYAGVPASPVSDLSEAGFATRTEPRLGTRADAKAMLREARARRI